MSMAPWVFDKNLDNPLSDYLISCRFNSFLTSNWFLLHLFIDLFPEMIAIFLLTLLRRGIIGAAKSVSRFNNASAKESASYWLQVYCTSMGLLS